MSPDLTPNSNEGEPASGSLPGPHSESDTSRQRMVARMESIVGTMSVRDPLMDKIDGPIISQMLTYSHDETKLQLLATTGLTVGIILTAVIAVVVICWLFLSYNKPEHINTVISMIAGFLGGFGTGRWYRPKS